MQMGLLLESHYVQQGSYPDSLDVLAGELGSVPVDPFTGNPYVYTPSNGTFSLYSLGPNGVDDGGRTARTQRDGDMVVLAVVFMVLSWIGRRRLDGMGA